jgi:hypothetical protein
MAGDVGGGTPWACDPVSSPTRGCSLSGPILPRPLSHLLVAFVSIAGLVACADDGRSPVEARDEGAVSVAAAAACAPTISNEILIGLIQGLKGEVDLLTSGDLINQGQAKALSRHLENAERQLAKGEYCAVQDQLTAFREQVEELVGAGFLSDRAAFELRLQSRMAMGPGKAVQPGGEEYAPGVSGELRTALIGGEAITYEVIDGLALLNSDMILGYADEFEAGIMAAGTSAGGPLPTTPCLNTELSCARWTDGVIGFDFFPDWGVHTPEMIDIVLQAINHWRAETGMEFERRTEGQRIVFRNGGGCSSWIGRNPFAIFDPQYVFLNWPGCASVGIAIHEIGHAVGLHHEQNRSGRINRVTINYDAIQDDKEYNFHECLALCQRVGNYDFGSIMHYGCGAFQVDGATKPSLEPLGGWGVTCDDLPNRTALSETDILGAYYLYRPEYQIVGASDGDVSDRFVLEAAFSTEPVDPQYIRWTVDRAERATGLTLSTLDLGLSEGTYIIGADLIIGGYPLDIQYLTLTIANDAPVVTLGPDREVDMNRAFTVTADVNDTEDGTCLTAACSYEWDPAPQSASGGSATYFFPAEGTVGITVTVTDGFGATGSDEVQVTVVDSPPEPVITAPAAATFSTGGITAYSGFATDANYGPGPDDGELPCGALTWSSSDPSDLLSSINSCGGIITFGDAGVRTLTLEAYDGSNTAITSISIEVDGCAGGCAPDISFVFDTPSDLDGSQYDLSFTGPGYLLGTTIDMTASIADSDGPPTAIALEWWVDPPCLGPGAECSDFQIGTGSVLAPNNAFMSWTPIEDWPAWSNCVLTPLPFIIRLHATDGAGNTRVYSRTIHLACDLR